MVFKREQVFHPECSHSKTKNRIIDKNNKNGLYCF
jgi:hypothetical protein